MDNVVGITLQEALDSGGGLRSILGLLKHTAAWTAEYHSFAFDDTPRSWVNADWPRGLRGRIDLSESYVAEVIGWFEDGARMAPVHRPVDRPGRTPTRASVDMWPSRDIVAYVASHWAYHAGEINLILGLRRAEAWEYGEHVEENHISPIGHSAVGRGSPTTTYDDMRARC